MSRPPHGRFRHRALIGYVFALLVMELYLRWFVAGTWILDPIFGFIPKPGTVIRHNSEGHGTSRWSDRGVRGARPVDSTKPPILVLGDSFTEGLTVDDDEVYTDVVARRLESHGIDIPVLNVGKSSASAADYVALASTYRAIFRPRRVVVELQSEDLGSDAWQPNKTHFTLVGGALVAEKVAVRFGRFSRILMAVRQRTKLVDAGIGRLSQYSYWLRQQPPLFHLRRARQPSELEEDSRPVEYPVAEEMRLLLKAYNQRVTFLLLPPLDPDRPMEIQSPIEREFDQLCHMERLSCVNMRQTFASFLDRGQSPFGFPNTAFNQGHMNREGHRVVGEMLEMELRRLAANDLL